MMNLKITDIIFVDYLNCPYKAYLKIHGKNGRKTDFEIMQNRFSNEYRTSAIDFLQNRWKKDKILGDSSLGQFRKGNYRKGINIRERLEEFDVLFDGIIKEPKPSDEFVPIIFVNKDNLGITDKLCLAFCGFALGATLKIMPSFGRIIYGSEHSNLRVKLGKFISRVSPIIEAIKSLANSEDSPQIYINRHCPICEFENSCLKIVKENDDLSLLSRLDIKSIKKLHNRGIFTINQLSYTFKPRRKRKTYRKKLNPFRPELKALALRENKVHVYETPELPKSDIEIYLDIESLPDRNFYYLIGLLVNDMGTISKCSFWADSKDQQYDIFRDLLNVLNEYDDYQIYHYGQFEKKYLKRMIKGLDENERNGTEKIVDRCCNILSFFYSNIYIPTFSNGLKDIAKYLGFNWENEKSSGIQSIIWRMEWEINRSSIIKKTLQQYNMDDCYALKMTKDFVSSISEREDDTESQGTDIVFQDHIKSSSPFKFLTREYADPAIKKIHKYSLFDYQRQRVFVRTDDFIRKSEKSKIKRKKSVLRPSKAITFTARVCVKCKSRNIHIGSPISKRIIDLKFTKSGIRRWITKLSSYIYHCEDCGRSFSPEKYAIGVDNIVPKGCRKNRTKYGHNIKSWAIYQHIVNDQSFRKIESNLFEYFNIAINKSSLHEFKNYILKYYNPTYELLLKKVLSSDVLYVDETPLKMKKEDGYAWVFTNNREIVSIYKPTREGDFLKDLLRDFNGILVSDFYAAYDSINCVHQKCLIHLIRDMNDDLLKNPFNEELKFVTKTFTALLQRIIKTIDRFGLKKDHLSKYNNDADRLLDRIAKSNFKTEIALYYQERFNKNKDKLFEFINYDNVSWNNNNAEKAIKLLATHTNRKIKMFSENRMREFLQIMSIYQTCVYNNVSFLKFLLSKERGFDKFIETCF